MQSRLLIFDLDETLVHARSEELARPHDFTVAGYFVYVRPHAAELLEFASRHFDLAVWSSSSAMYVEAVVERLFGAKHPLVFSWAVEKCIQRVDTRSNGYVYIKDLRKTQSHGYPLDRVTIVDDSAEKVQRQPRNHVHVSPFLGDTSDQGLLAVVAQLRTLAAQDAEAKMRSNPSFKRTPDGAAEVKR